MKIKMTLLAATSMVSFAGAETTSPAAKTECKTECATKSKEDCMKACSTDKAIVTHFNVTGMTCGGCSKSLTTALTAIKGVDIKKICHKSGCVDVVLTDGATAAQVKEVITKKGFKIAPAKEKKV
ncbi:MAG: heavy-metal-associated domain-containing protein [Rubritalea sp.]|uniref:heavy-metal-associated domain-containing protein n=1 Tax=Rubritalea sp. TaxID=2109375 RepID=UPI0032422876